FKNNNSMKFAKKTSAHSARSACYARPATSVIPSTSAVSAAPAVSTCSSSSSSVPAPSAVRPIVPVVKAVSTRALQPSQPAQVLVVTNQDLSAVFAKVRSGYLDEVLQNSGNYSFILDGKSFLKRLTTVEMYVDHPEWNEGIMSNERKKQISKKAILKAFNLKGRNEIARLDGNKIDDNSCLNFVWSAIGVAFESEGEDLGIEMSNQLLSKWL
ncbi:hypothetical protein BGZ46_005829, partial [Entomortierella lignicola]